VPIQEEAPCTAAEGNSSSNSEGINVGSQDGAQQRHQHSDDRIYPRGANLYWEAGWHAPLPFKPGTKSPPLKGWTGHEGHWPTKEQIVQWAEEESPRSNVGLRLNYGLLGIDVDAYDAKTGGRTLKEAESRWGPLPPTYRSSSRVEDDVSGIRVFRVPMGVYFRGMVGFKELGIGDIEIVQPHHRVVIAWPSIHPKTGQRYSWFGPDGILLPEGQVPRIEDLAELPEAWVTGLAKDSVREEFFDGSAPNRPRVSDAVVDEGIYRGLVDLKDNGMPDALVAARLQKALLELTNGSGSRYDTTRDHVAALMRSHSLGRTGVARALSELFPAYVSEVADTRPHRVAVAEFQRFTEGAALLVAANPTLDPWRTLGMGEPGTVIGDGRDATVGHEGQSSWAYVDLKGLVQGECEPLRPTLFERSDGHCLLYPGLVHSFHGESESGKSLIIQAECVRLINEGQDALYVDFDSDSASVVGRLLEFGADPQAVVEHFHYVQPEVKPHSPEERGAWEEMLSREYVLAVIDGVTDALGISGYSTKENDDVSRWIREVPKVIAARTGAAVVLIDHVTKDPASRNRFAIGGQAKMAGLTGAAYTVEVAAALGRGMRGEVLLRIGKDRPGAVRPHCGSFRRTDRTQEAARIIVDSTVDPPTITIGAPGARVDENSSGPGTFRPTNLMQRVSEAIEQQPGKLAKNKAVTMAGGKRQHTLIAFDILDHEGYLNSERGQSGHNVFSSVKPYRETDDEQSDRYVKPGNAFGTN
jgi:hypothetical protein